MKKLQSDLLCGKSDSVWRSASGKGSGKKPAPDTVFQALRELGVADAAACGVRRRLGCGSGDGCVISGMDGIAVCWGFRSQGVSAGAWGCAGADSSEY